MDLTHQPSAEEVRRYPQLHVSNHPLIRQKMTLLRHVETREKRFEELVSEISALLGYEAMADLPMRTISTQTPMEITEGCEWANRIALIPVLRAGLGMVSAFRQLVPSARVWHLGLTRDEHTLEAKEYYNKLPKLRERHICFILDPMLAAGGHAVKSIAMLKERGAERIKYVSLIAAPFGVKQVVTQFPDVTLHVASLDRCLNERGYILPGLGDAGDRQFDLG